MSQSSVGKSVSWAWLVIVTLVGFACHEQSQADALDWAYGSVSYCEAEPGVDTRYETARYIRDQLDDYGE